jgi:hypothetical protein
VSAAKDGLATDQAPKATRVAPRTACPSLDITA